MIIRKAYRFRLKTNSEIEQMLWRFAGHCRFVWNYFWSLNQSRLQNKQRVMRYAEMDYWSKLLKQSDEYQFLREAPAHIIQQKLRDLDRAYQDGFDRTQPNKRLPHKRKKFVHSSFRFPEPKQFKIENKRIWLPKLGWIRFFKSQEIKGSVQNVTLSYQAGCWYVSIQVEVEMETVQQKPECSTAVGIDLGIAQLATVASNDGRVKIYAPRNSFKHYQGQLARAQRQLSRKEKFSKNWSKQKRQVQRYHARIANIRKDHLHRISHEVCKNHAEIYVEDLKVVNMMHSARGTVAEPGRNVRAKSGLNRAIHDQGWSELRRQLEYKSSWRGGVVIAINPRYTSQRCSHCGHTAADNRTTQSQFFCQACGFAMNADANAARNILAAGLCRDGLWIESYQGSEAETCGKARAATTL